MKRIVTVIASLCLLAGLLVLGVGIYKAVDPFAGSRQANAQRNLVHSWPSPTADPPSVSTAANSTACVPKTHAKPGQVFALIQIPAFGRDWKFTVIEGTTLTQLATGPGHIIGTPFPGQPGNTAIAAHDVTAGNPFLHLAELKPGSRIIITTQDCVTTYVVNRSSYRVLYTDMSVLKPTKGVNTITLITCWPVNVLYFVQHRTIINGTEISSVRR
jgi:sortase A